MACLAGEAELRVVERRANERNNFVLLCIRHGEEREGASLIFGRKKFAFLNFDRKTTKKTKPPPPFNGTLFARRRRPAGRCFRRAVYVRRPLSPEFKKITPTAITRIYFFRSFSARNSTENNRRARETPENPLELVRPTRHSGLTKPSENTRNT